MALGHSKESEIELDVELKDVERINRYRNNEYD